MREPGVRGDGWACHHAAMNAEALQRLPETVSLAMVRQLLRLSAEEVSSALAEGSLVLSCREAAISAEAAVGPRVDVPASLEFFDRRLKNRLLLPSTAKPSVGPCTN